MVEDFNENYISGWIKIFRSIKNHWLWSKNKPLTQFEAWITILLEVNHSDSKIAIGYDIFECKRGQSLNSLDTWAKLFNWNRSKVRRFFKMLQDDNMISILNVKKTTQITVCKYDSYQGVRNISETQTKRKRNASEHKQEYKKNKNEKNNTYSEFFEKTYFEKSPEIDSAFKDYLNIRVKNKFTMTDRAINALVKKLREYSNGEKKEALHIIDNAILGKWKSFYSNGNYNG